MKPMKMFLPPSLSYPETPSPQPKCSSALSSASSPQSKPRSPSSPQPTGSPPQPAGSSPPSLFPTANVTNGVLKRFMTRQNYALSSQSAQAVQNAFRGMRARIRVRKIKEFRDLVLKWMLYFVLPVGGSWLLYSSYMALRCSLPFFPLPADGLVVFGWRGGCEALPNWWVPSNISTTWRQRIECCDGQQMRLPIPRGAEFHDLIALQWFDQGKRYISYQKLDEPVFLRAPEAEFNLPWSVVGRPGEHGPVPCMPNPLRDCQYGDTKYVEMAAVQLSCDAPDGQCHASIPWSFGAHTFTMPTHSHAPDDEDGDGLHDEGEGSQDITMAASRNIMYLASFPPEFNLRVPPTLPSRPPHFPMEIEGIRGPAKDRPIETYPIALAERRAAIAGAALVGRPPPAVRAGPFGLPAGALATVSVLALLGVARLTRVGAAWGAAPSTGTAGGVML